MLRIPTIHVLTRKRIPASLTLVISLAAVAGVALAAQNKYTVKALNGVAFSEFRGYENWQDVAVSATDTGIKAIVADPIMIKAYRDGVPGNGKHFPDGAKIAKIEWAQKKNPESPYAVMVPGDLRSVSFIEKDSKRFPDSSGWGYAQFLYDPASQTFKPYGDDAAFGTKVCYACHVAVAAKDYIFTAYPTR